MPLPRCEDDGNGKYITKTYFCDADFYIACDKGNEGYKSTFTAFKGRIDETDEEYAVTITAVTENDVLAQIKEANDKEHLSIRQFFRDYLTSNLGNFDTEPADIIRCAEETVFLDLEEQSEYRKISVCPAHDKYRLSVDECYKLADTKTWGLRAGDYIYTEPMRNVTEILQIEYFAHSPYARFYAVAKPTLLYPRDKADIMEKLPELYVKCCIPAYEQDKNNITMLAAEIPYIPKDNQVGDNIIWRKLFFTKHYCLIESGVFHLSIGKKGVLGGFEASSGSRLRVGVDSENALLIQVGDKFKILIYHCKRVVKYGGDYYGQFTYYNESEFFEDFRERPVIPGYHDDMFKGIKYLLYRGEITPVEISRERYEEFKRKDN